MKTETTAPIVFRPMSDMEFRAYLTISLEEYAQARSANSDTPLDEEREKAKAQTYGLLINGVATEDHFLWHIVVNDLVIGCLWVFVDKLHSRAFIYDIRLAEEHRGKGLGNRVLDVLQERLRRDGVRRLALNVFADNVVARRLYEGQGFQPTNINLEKQL